MKRTDQILQELATDTVPLAASRIAGRMNTVQQNISKALAELVDRNLLSASNDRPATYLITDAGRDYVNGPDFGKEERTLPSVSAAPAMPSLNMGIFTNGEMHIEANGKKVLLNRDQSKQLVEFVCDLPNKLFSTPAERPSLASLPSRTHRLADD